MNKVAVEVERLGARVGHEGAFRLAALLPHRAGECEREGAGLALRVRRVEEPVHVVLRIAEQQAGGLAGVGVVDLDAQLRRRVGELP